MTSHLSDYLRVLSIARRPTKDEFLKIAQLTGIGIIAIGLIGFVITFIFQIIGI